MSQSLDTPRQSIALSGCYFFFFALLGLIVPYWGAYLTDLNFSSAQIGELMAILMATRIVMPVIWAAHVDKTEQRLSAIRWGSLFSFLFFCGFFFADTYWTIAIVLMLFASCWSAILPQMEVVTLSTLAKRSHDYSKIRAWGSIGFIVLVTVGGFIFEYFGIKWLITVGAIVLVGLMLVTTLIAYHPQKAVTDSVGGETSFYQTLKNPNVILFMAAILLLQVSHGPYYNFFVLYLMDAGYSESFAGLQIGLGVVAEVVVFVVTARLLQRFGAKQLLFVSLLLSALRWIVMPFVTDNVVLLSANQLLHAASFGSAHAAAMAMLNYWFVGGARGRGQALYASICFGVGGVIGALYSGYTWQEGAGSTMSWYIAAVIALLATGLVTLIQYPQQHQIKQ